MDSSKYFPLDAAFEILSRTPCLTTLDACKLTCRDWNQLQREPIFMPTYWKKTKNFCGFILQSHHFQEFVSLEPAKRDEIKLASFPEKHVEIAAAASKQGLLCGVGMFQYREHRFYVGKPATGQWLHLPNPDLDRFYTVSVAMAVLGSSPLRYKIIRLSHLNMKYRHPKNHANWTRYHCEIFDSKTWEWKTLMKDIKLGLNVFLVDSSQPVQVGNLVHWLTNDRQVLVFNCDDETHHRIPLPEAELSDHRYSFKHSLIEYEGRLGLMNSTNVENTEVWVLIGGEWRLAKEFEVEIENGKPVGLYNRDIVLKAEWGKVVFCNLHDSSTLKSLKTCVYDIHQIFPFRTDFEPVDL